MTKREQQELTEEAKQRITRLVRSLVEDRVERGVQLERAMHCDSCDQEKPSAGSALYGAYKLCNDCLLDFTKTLASTDVANVVDYMTSRPGDRGSPPPSDLDAKRERSPLQLKSLKGRDKPMPSG